MQSRGQSRGNLRYTFAKSGNAMSRELVLGKVNRFTGHLVHFPLENIDFTAIVAVLSRKVNRFAANRRHFPLGRNLTIVFTAILPASIVRLIRESERSGSPGAGNFGPADNSGRQSSQSRIKFVSLGSADNFAQSGTGQFWLHLCNLLICNIL